MPYYYLDSSALAKAYVLEPGTSRIEQLIQNEALVVSSLVYVELASVFARRSREGRLSDALRVHLYQRLASDLGGFDVIEASDRILIAAARRMIERPDIVVRAADAIHLATAEQSFILARQAGVTDCVFVCADRRLSDAARAVGLTVEDPSAH